MASGSFRISRCMSRGMPTCTVLFTWVPPPSTWSVGSPIARRSSFAATSSQRAQSCGERSSGLSDWSRSTSLPCIARPSRAWRSFMSATAFTLSRARTSACSVSQAATRGFQSQRACQRVISVRLFDNCLATADTFRVRPWSRQARKAA